MKYDNIYADGSRAIYATLQLADTNCKSLRVAVEEFDESRRFVGHWLCDPTGNRQISSYTFGPYKPEKPNQTETTKPKENQTMINKITIVNPAVVKSGEVTKEEEIVLLEHAVSADSKEIALLLCGRNQHDKLKSIGPASRVHVSTLTV
jgi:hypothetical protein